MKTCSRFTLIRTLLFTLILCLADRQAHSQGLITIVGPPNGTRITDCETGLLIGSGYTAAIQWAPGSVTDPNAFLQLGGTMNIINGQLAGGTRTITAPGAGSVNLFAEAWQTSAGTTYQQASQVVGAKVGRSAIISAVPGGPAVRFPDFQVCPVPEPSTWALLGFGLLTVVLRRSRKS